jgi:molybdopterin synthase sulfur carrier subunit
MKTKLLFFGRLAERLGREREVDIPDAGCTVAALRQLLGDSDPAAGELMASGSILASVDQEMATDEVFVHPGQEVAFFSPLSGG